MILLDENLIESQILLLRSWGIRARQVGVGLGRKGMTDQEVLPLLHKIHVATFFTRDMGFYRRENVHVSYALVCLDVAQFEAASFVRRFLKHPRFRTQVKRMGTVARASHVSVRFWIMGSRSESEAAWTPEY